MGTLANRTALVTGGSRGIGRAIARRLAAEGALVAVHYGHDEAAAAQTIELITSDGGRAFAVHARLGDTGSTGEIDDGVEAAGDGGTDAGAASLWAAFDNGLRAHGGGEGLDILVNNAAIGWSRAIGEVTPGEFDRVFAVNVKAPFFVVQRGLGRIRDGGRIINISSGVARIAFPQTIAYSLTKGALNTFSLTLAKELGARGITVNSVAPGIVAAGSNVSLPDDPQALARAASYSVFNRIGRPEDIADVVAFVASPDARWITGQVIDVTGGAKL